MEHAAREIQNARKCYRDVSPTFHFGCSRIVMPEAKKGNATGKIRFVSKFMFASSLQIAILLPRPTAQL